MHQIEHTDEVDVDGIDEGLLRTTFGQRRDAGVGQNDVELAEFSDTGVDGSGQRHAVTDVGDHGKGSAAFLLHQTCGLIEVLRPGQRVVVGGDVLAQIDGDDVGALGGQKSGV